MKSEMAIHTIRTGYDNYTYVVTDGAECVVVDASDSASVFDFIEIHCLSLRAIFSTHHHSDHTSGNAELKERTGCVVYGPDQKTLSVDVVVAGNMNYDNVLPGLNVMPVPGHTKTAVAYHLISPAAVFTGDTLFCAG